MNNNTDLLPLELIQDEVTSFRSWTGLDDAELTDVIHHYQNVHSAHRRAAKECLRRIIENVKGYCMARGITKFCHWFNTWADSAAYKRDRIQDLSVSTLFQGEPDASSKPSGDLRSTYEARGYTVWDSRSPLFVLHQNTLCIPTLFLTYHGETMDLKSPLLRAREAFAQAAWRVLSLVEPGRFDPAHQIIEMFVGPEQEYFLLPRDLVKGRPDLLMCDATLMGTPPPRSQQLEEHYLGSIKPHIIAFFEEFNAEVERLGIVPRTDHNEVAPMQFEFAALHREASRAADQNLLVMNVLSEVAERHGLVSITHEKPFAELNGSGKHINFSPWVVERKTGAFVANLLTPQEDPGADPSRSLTFLLVLLALARGVQRNYGLIRASVASRSNDTRLGGNEAPPAIISVYLGETMEAALRRLQGVHKEEARPAAQEINLALDGVPLVTVDNTDRNRTAPFAFTGDKFEFRMAGSNTPVFIPMAMIMAAYAEGLHEVADHIEAHHTKGAEGRNNVNMETLVWLIEQTAPIRYLGDCYSPEWREEAKSRGLAAIEHTPEALKAYLDPEVQARLERLGIWSLLESTAFAQAKMAEYSKKVLIEARTLLQMARTAIHPAAVEAHLRLAKRALRMGQLMEMRGRLSQAAPETGHLTQALGEEQAMASLVARLELAIDEVRASLERYNGQNGHAQLAPTLAEKLLPVMAGLRQACNALEEVLPQGLYPYPTYEKILFEQR